MSADRESEPAGIPLPPRGLAILAALGPGLVWCGEYIGSGEVILATRSGAMFGVAVLWVPVLAIFLKYWIGLAGAHYTVTTGEGMIDMMSRMPGPRNWVVWPVFVGQLCMGAIATGALASTTGVFASYFIPVSQVVLGWVAVLIVIALVWSGLFTPIQRSMALLVLLIILGTMAVAIRTWPSIGELVTGLFGFDVPSIPDWAKKHDKPMATAWSEILPLLGWAAGGFASQVWYTYWVIGAGYGMAHGRSYGQPLDERRLRAATLEDAERIRGWRKVVTFDATMALVIGTVVTSAFMIAGSGVLRPAKLLPEESEVAITLSRIFGEHWGTLGAHLFVLAGLAAMLSTMLGQFAGWPRLLADCARVLFPPVSRYSWKVQFRTVLVLYAVSNMVIVYTFGLKPVMLVKLGAVLDGLLLTPLQALALVVGLYVVMPQYFSDAIRPRIRASYLLLPGLIAAFIVYSYFCIVQIPVELSK